MENYEKSSVKVFNTQPYPVILMSIELLNLRHGINKCRKLKSPLVYREWSVNWKYSTFWRSLKLLASERKTISLLWSSTPSYPIKHLNKKNLLHIITAIITKQKFQIIDVWLLKDKNS